MRNDCSHSTTFTALAMWNGWRALLAAVARATPTPTPRCCSFLDKNRRSAVRDATSAGFPRHRPPLQSNLAGRAGVSWAALALPTPDPADV
jgi:hypothetical protein